MIVPYGEIGKYGGVARITLGDNWTFFNWEAALTISPDLHTLLPQPVVISSRMKNVVPEGIWGWDNRWTLAYHPSTWYFNNGVGVKCQSKSPLLWHLTPTPLSNGMPCTSSDRRPHQRW